METINNNTNQIINNKTNMINYLNQILDNYFNKLTIKDKEIKEFSINLEKKNKIINEIKSQKNDEK